MATLHHAHRKKNRVAHLSQPFESRLLVATHVRFLNWTNRQVPLPVHVEDGPLPLPVYMEDRPLPLPYPFPAHVEDRKRSSQVSPQLYGPAKGGSVAADKPFFDGIQPVAYLAGIAGILPVSRRPSLRVSFAPCGSTLVYTLAVQALVVFSCWTEYSERLEHLDDADYPNSGEYLFDVMSLVHVAGWMITPFLWVESRHIRHRDAICRRIMTRFGHLLSAESAVSPWPRRLSWCTVALSVLTPVLATVWVSFKARTNSSLMHIPAHTYVNVLVLCGTSMPVLSAMRIRDFAQALADDLRKTLATVGATSPRLVADFQVAWLQLRTLNRELVATPLSFALLTALQLAIIALQTFMVLSVMLVDEQSLQGGVLLLAMDLPCLLVLLLVCEMAQRATSAIRGQFLQILEMPYPPYLDKMSRRELHQFLEVVWWNNPGTTVADFYELKRSSFGTIVAVIATYIVGMLQFELSFRSGEAAAANNSSLKC